MQEIFNEELQALQEMFFGKLPGLIQIEEYFDKLKRRYERENVLTSGSAYRELVRDPILQKIGDLIARMFGFKEVAVTIARNPHFNAYTIPFVVDSNGNSYDLNDRRVSYKHLVGAVTVNNSGFMFNKKKFPANLLICLNLGCLFKTPISTSEMMAVLLHEIGHNFAMVVMSHSMTERSEEKFADQFASMYGYGPELASGLSKVMINYSEFDKAWKDVPILNVLVGLNQIRKNIGNVSDDNPHPVTKNRILGVIRQLEQDLKDTPNLTPGMRQDIQKQIKRCKDVADRVFSVNPDDNIGARMTNYYFGEVEPNLHAEKEGEREAEKFSAPTNVNQKIGTMIHKRGWFR